MRRKLFTFAAAVSAVLCVAVCGLWVRSYWRMDESALTWRGSRYGLRSDAGKLVALLSSEPGDRFRELRFWWGAEASHSGSSYGVLPRNGSRAGPFGTYFADFTYAVPPLYLVKGRRAVLLMPHWMPAAAAAVLPAALFISTTVRRLRVARRVRLGLCPRCGYDLRATPGRCPEMFSRL